MKIGQRWPESGMPKCEIIFAQALSSRLIIGNQNRHFGRARAAGNKKASFNLDAVCAVTLRNKRDTSMGFGILSYE
jgi:hypothetical protein